MPALSRAQANLLANIFNDVEGSLKKYWRKRERKVESVRLKQLVRYRYLRQFKDEDEIYYQLSDKGRREVMKAKIKSAPELPKDQIIFIAFDIPNKNKEVRDQLRWILKQNNFLCLQKSLWFTKRNVYKLLADLIKELKMEGWVTIILAKKFFA